jgi:hypothetical protein
VALRSVAIGECLQIEAPGHRIRLALPDLRALAVDAGTVLNDMAPRMRRLFEARAQGLLGRVAGWPVEGACVSAGELNAEDRLLVAELLKGGRAAVLAPEALKTIWVRYFGQRALGRGEVLFYVTRDGAPFFSVVWWSA